MNEINSDSLLLTQLPERIERLEFNHEISTVLLHKLESLMCNEKIALNRKVSPQKGETNFATGGTSVMLS
jgi:hypothetical protein